MRIAVACDDERVSDHFGHCREFHLMDVMDHDVLSHAIIPNPGHTPGYLPRYLHKKGVDVVISGGMGSKAQELFRKINIDVVTGAQGSPHTVVEQYLKGQLATDGETCRKHLFHGQCSH